MAERFASGIFKLFRIKYDQSEHILEYFSAPLKEIGFEVIMERRQVQSSEIFVIIGKKNGNTNRSLKGS
jgi:hypothetical protein